MSALRDLNVLPLIHRYRPKIFLETGTGFGSGLVRMCQPEFDMHLLISIDIEKELVDIASKFFRGDTRIKVFCGPSAEALTHILPQIALSSPILFFSDAHFARSDVTPLSGSMTKHSDGADDVRCPMWNELKIWKELRTDRGARDVIICDDIFLYDERDIYGDNVARLGPGAVPENQRNLLPKIKEMFSKTHDAEEIHQWQGFLILRPK